MHYPRPRHRIHPKVSTMPRQRSEAAQYLDLYKLTVEKTRLSQELLNIEKRRDRIQERLETLEHQIKDVKTQRLRQPQTASEPNSIIYPPAYYADTQNGSLDDPNFETVTLDY